jgi:hypothetical protein
MIQIKTKRNKKKRTKEKEEEKQNEISKGEKILSTHIEEENTGHCAFCAANRKIRSQCDSTAILKFEIVNARHY